MGYAILAIIWIFCAVADYGMWLAYCQREFPAIAERDYNKDVTVALIGCLFGPVSIIGTLFVYFIFGSEWHGFMWRKEKGVTK